MPGRQLNKLLGGTEEWEGISHDRQRVTEEFSTVLVQGWDCGVLEDAKMWHGGLESEGLEMNLMEWP